MVLVSDLLRSMLHPEEVGSMIRLKLKQHAQLGSPRIVSLRQWIDVATRVSSLNSIDGCWMFCWAALDRVSRSFALVIRLLPEELQRSVLVFYLCLRALDTIEDDMAISLELKIPLLHQLHNKLRVQSQFVVDGIGYDDEKTLLQELPRLFKALHQLPQDHIDIILDITMQMGGGMAHAAQLQSCDTVNQYDLYCHYVAGLVGHGLSRLFIATGHMHVSARNHNHVLKLANSMGLLLQKTNIIRDIYEDLRDGRTWWPKQVWSAHAPSNASLDWFLHNAHSPQCRSVLDAMIDDALRHIPDCLEYLSLLSTSHRGVFSFCSIPQVMALATLAECRMRRNDVFRRVIKIRKGLSARIMETCGTLPDARRWFSLCLSRLRVHNPNSAASPCNPMQHALMNPLCYPLTNSSATVTMGSAWSPSLLAARALPKLAGVVTVIACIWMLVSSLFYALSQGLTSSRASTPEIALVGGAAVSVYLLAYAAANSESWLSLL